MLLEEKLEGRKAQSLPFLLSRNMKYHTLKNVGFCPNEVIHFKQRIKQTLKSCYKQLTSSQSVFNSLQNIVKD